MSIFEEYGAFNFDEASLSDALPNALPFLVHLSRRLKVSYCDH